MQGGTSPKTQPFSEHVKELRRRSLFTIATLFLGTIAGFFIYRPLFGIIRHPLHQQLYYTTPTGGFNAVVKVSIMFGVILTVPVFVYHVGKFLSPAFKRRFRATRVVLFSTILAISGILFAYYVSLPAALHFLANIDSKDLQSIITVNEYLSFVTAYLAGFALLFQLPLIMLFINRIKPQRPGSLMRIQRWVILGSFIVAAILTPTPDPFNQFIMAAPIILLYQFSVVLIWFVNRKNVAPAAAIIQPEPVAEPQTIPVPVIDSAPVGPQVAKSRQPKLIMDVFWIPHNPGA
jgi:sec-independent protein translocase protein TatC